MFRLLFNVSCACVYARSFKKEDDGPKNGEKEKRNKQKIRTRKKKGTRKGGRSDKEPSE